MRRLHPFAPRQFLDIVSGASILRFSGWQRTDPNDYNAKNSARDPAVRTTPEFSTQNRLDGVSMEHMIELCNVIGSSPWYEYLRTKIPEPRRESDVAS